MLKPFNGEAVITSKFSTKHPGLDYALPHRTAIIAVYSGQVVMLEKDISKKNKKGVKQWIANTDNDPYKYSVGKIIFSRKLKTEDYGNFVKVDHGGKIQTLSAHLDEVVVTEGQWVKKGEILGYSDSTGNSTGGHVHFEVIYNGKRVDPDVFEANNPHFEGMFNAKSYEFFVYNGVIETRTKLYIRELPTRGAKTVTVGKHDYYLAGTTVKVKGFVKGERVKYDTIESTQFWWVTESGNYIWSGATSVVPTLDDFPEQLHKKFKKLPLENKMEELKAKLAELETERNTLVSDLAEVNGDIAQLQAEIVELENTPAVEEPAVEAVEEVVEPVEEVVTEVSEEDAVKAELRALIERATAKLNELGN